MSNPRKAPPKAKTVVPSAEALPPVGSVPAVRDKYKPLAGNAKQALLKVPAEQRAEVVQAFEQLWTARARLATDLGTLAPDAANGKALLERMQKAHELNAKVASLSVFADDQEALANHAAMAFLNEVANDIEHMAQKNPQIATRFAAIITVVEQRREAIVAGMAEAKANKKDPTKTT